MANKVASRRHTPRQIQQMPSDMAVYGQVLATWRNQHAAHYKWSTALINSKRALERNLCIEVDLHLLVAAWPIIFYTCVIRN